MTKVIISFSADDSMIGKTVDLDEDSARVAVREGRARYADEADAPASTAPTDVPPMPGLTTAPAVSTE